MSWKSEKQGIDMNRVFLKVLKITATTVLLLVTGVAAVLLLANRKDTEVSDVAISDWLSWQIPKSEDIEEEGYKADIGECGGELFTWTGDSPYTTNGSDSAAEEWRAAGGILRNSREFFVFEDGILTNLHYNYNHSIVMQEAESLDGCEEQAVIMQMNHDLFTAPELYMAEESGKPIPENEQTVNMWYVGMARENAEYGYVFFLNGRYYDKEDAIAFARSVRFTDNAWK